MAYDVLDKTKEEASVEADTVSGMGATPTKRTYSKSDFTKDTEEAVREAKANLKDNAGQLKEDLRKMGTSLKSDMSVAANQLGQNVRQFFDSRREDMVEAADAYSATVRAKPIQSSLLAMGAGFLLASLLRRR